MIIAPRNICHNRFWRRKGHVLGTDTISQISFFGKQYFSCFPCSRSTLRFWSRFWSCPRRPLRMRISARAAFIVRAIILAVNRASVFDERAARSRALRLMFAFRETCPRGLENLFRWKLLRERIKLNNKIVQYYYIYLFYINTLYKDIFNLFENSVTDRFDDNIYVIYILVF